MVGMEYSSMDDHMEKKSTLSSTTFYAIAHQIESPNGFCKREVICTALCLLNFLYQGSYRLEGKKITGFFSRAFLGQQPPTPGTDINIELVLRYDITQTCAHSHTHNRKIHVMRMRCIFQSFIS